MIAQRDIKKKKDGSIFKKVNRNCINERNLFTEIAIYQVFITPKLLKEIIVK